MTRKTPTATKTGHAPRARSSARSDAKSARGRARAPAPTKRARRSYTDEQRAEALEVMRDEGLAAAHDATAIPKGTLSRWARAAGLDLDEQARARTAAAAAAVEAGAAELKRDIVTRLRDVLDRSLDTLEDLVALEGEATDGIRSSPELVAAVVDRDASANVIRFVLQHGDHEVAQALGRLKLVGEVVNRRDVVGGIGLLVDKVELLAGRATERGELVVHFGIPRPDPQAQDAAAVEESTGEPPAPPAGTGAG